MKKVYVVCYNGIIQSIHRTKNGAKKRLEKRLEKLSDGYILTYITKQ